MENRNNDKNWGQILDAERKKHNLSIKDLTKKAGYKRGAYNYHKKSSYLKLKVLHKYARVLGDEFLQDHPDREKYILEESSVDYETAHFDKTVRKINKTIESLIEIRDECFKLKDMYKECYKKLKKKDRDL